MATTITNVSRRRSRGKKSIEITLTGTEFPIEYTSDDKILMYNMVDSSYVTGRNIPTKSSTTKWAADFRLIGMKPGQTSLEVLIDGVSATAKPNAFNID